MAGWWLVKSFAIICGAPMSTDFILSALIVHPIPSGRDKSIGIVTIHVVPRVISATLQNEAQSCTTGAHEIFAWPARCGLPEESK